MKHVSIGFGAVAVLWGCSTAPSGPPPGVKVDVEAGLQLIHSSCQSCHGLESLAAAQIAPSWADIAGAYQGDRGGLAAYLSQPDRVAPRMNEAVERFGPMPNMGLTRTQAANVAAFIATTDFLQTGWSAHTAGEATAVNPLEQAANWARATKGVLGKNLMAALAAGGPAHAVPFCNERAIPLTDSMSQALNVRIRRVSDRPRNAANRATGESAAYLARQHDRAEWTPELLTAHSSHTAFIPITTNAMCLQCHGQMGTDIAAETAGLIAERYPEDDATGYAAGQLRGAWVVEFDAE